MPEKPTLFPIHLYLFHRYRITVLFMIPSVVHQLVNYPDIDKVDLSSVQTLGSGAAYLPPDIAQKLLSYAPAGASFVEGSLFLIHTTLN